MWLLFLGLLGAKGSQCIGILFPRTGLLLGQVGFVVFCTLACNTWRLIARTGLKAFNLQPVLLRELYDLITEIINVYLHVAGLLNLAVFS